MLKRERNISAFTALVFLLFQNITADDVERRRQTTNYAACLEIDYSVYSPDCYEYLGMSSWNQETLDEICSNSGVTDRSTDAKLCDSDTAGNPVDVEEYITRLRLSILNTMYGTSPIPPRGSCGFWCMYDTLNVQTEKGVQAIGYRWNNVDACWKLILNENDALCYHTPEKDSKEFNWAITKSERWCPGSTCESYGDPHIYNFDGEEVPMQHSLGDYLMYQSTTLRIDARMLPYYSNQGSLWGSVTGIHATAIEVIDGDCNVKIEVYSKYQTENNRVKFLFNGDEVGWNELERSFSECDEICSVEELYEIDEANSFFSVTFADAVMVTVRNVENMHALFITVPFYTLGADADVLNEAQVCTGGMRLLNCENDQTILSQYVNCDVLTPPPTAGGTCDRNIQRIVVEECRNCTENDCLIAKHVESCEFDGCEHLPLREAWESGDVELALQLARDLADYYCEMSKEETVVCPTDPTPLPTRVFEDFPTRAPSYSPSPDPTVSPSQSPSNIPTFNPTESPTESPTPGPTLSPTETPTEKPTIQPTPIPTRHPTSQPTESPTAIPTHAPTAAPSHHPSENPTLSPTSSPTLTPTQAPTESPTWSPTSNPICPYLAHSLSCRLPSTEFYVNITGIDDLDEEAGLQYCAERCFRENTDWLVYGAGQCICVIGSCQTPFDEALPYKSYRILPCGLECAEITSEEWWGQEPTSTEHINGIIATKPVKGLRFTSEINVEVHMVGIKMVLTTDDPPQLPEDTLVIIPRMFLAGENRMLASGGVEMPAFMDDAYDGSYGRMAMTFLTADINNKYPYTLSFEFHHGSADVFVSENTHIFHDGNVADDVFAVRGNTIGQEPNQVDLKAPHVVICYIEKPCERKYGPWEFSVEHMENLCPDGFGSADKTIYNSCRPIDYLEKTIKTSLMNKMFGSCDSDCLFDNNWPLLLSFGWTTSQPEFPEGCWALMLEGACLTTYPDVAVLMDERARDLASCVNFTAPTPVPTPEDIHPCTQDAIDDGTSMLLSIHAAYEVIEDVCTVIGEQTALLDGGFIFGSSCSAVAGNMTDYDWDVMLCSSYEKYCDYGKLLLSPNFTVDNETTLELLKLTDLLSSIWGIEFWGVELRMSRSMSLNAVGLYLSSLSENEYLNFYLQDSNYASITEGNMDVGLNPVASWYYRIVPNDTQLDHEEYYYLLFRFNFLLTTSNAYIIQTKIRVYTDVTMPYSVGDDFTVESFVSGFANSFSKSLNPEMVPLICLKFCRNLPTAGPTVLPTYTPTPDPTIFCKFVDIQLVGYPSTVYDFPSWFYEIGGQYEGSVRYIDGDFTIKYVQLDNSNFRLEYLESEWKISDTSQEYVFQLTNPGENGFIPINGEVSSWAWSTELHSGDIDLFLNCSVTLPPTPIIPTSEPTNKTCAILRVVTLDQSVDTANRYDGLYYVVNSDDDYVYISGRNQWYKNRLKSEGHIFWMDHDPPTPLWANSWIIHSQAGYLVVEATAQTRPETDDYRVYPSGSLVHSDEARVQILCATNPPTERPTDIPTRFPTTVPTLKPSNPPSLAPTQYPSTTPSLSPTANPSSVPTSSPTLQPSFVPTSFPTRSPTHAPTYEPYCPYLSLGSIPEDKIPNFFEFDGNYTVKKTLDTLDYLDKRNGIPQWVNAKKGYVIYFITEGVFANRWTIQAVEEAEDEYGENLINSRDYYLVSADEVEWTDEQELNNPPRAGRWQVFSASTWHIIGDFFFVIEIECRSEFGTSLPTVSPTPIPRSNASCIYVNWTYTEDSEGGWFGVYTRIENPEYKNGKVHYTGPDGNQLYWMDDGVFGQRWIIACAEGTILAYEDAEDSPNVPSHVEWQQIGFSSCLGHCVDFGNDVNITITELTSCAPTKVPTTEPTHSPTEPPTSKPTTQPSNLPTSSPTQAPSVIPTPSPTKLPTTSLPTGQPSSMPSPAPTRSPTTSTPEPTEHPTYAPTNSPTAWPTDFCECLRISTEGDYISDLFTMVEMRNGRFQWQDGNTGWTLFWVEDGVFGQTWVIQGDEHDTYWAVAGIRGNGMPPFNGEWQKFTTSGYNLASDEFLTVDINCTICEDTFSPTFKPTEFPTSVPTPSPTCQENYITLLGCCGDDYEGIYERQDSEKNGKNHYLSRNGYEVYYVHDGMFENHWVSQSPDKDYFYLVRFTEIGVEPVLNRPEPWRVYRGSSFFHIGETNITVVCSYSLEPTRSPSEVPSRPPTEGPTRSPSPSPTILPTLAPSPKPSQVPSPAPSAIPSTLPTPTPSKLPTTLLPSRSPSLMPSPSPTKMPTTLDPTPLSARPTAQPTVSPSKLPTSWCRCILATGGTDYDGLYEQTGLTYNQHYEWRNEDQKPLFWHDPDYYNSSISWAIKGNSSALVYEAVDSDWLNTPPLSTETWYEYSAGSIADGHEVVLTLSCTTCNPTRLPTPVPTARPSSMPSPSPSDLPTTSQPSLSPSLMPSPSPSKLPTTPLPSANPSLMPSPSPSPAPSTRPSPTPTKLPTTRLPSHQPSMMPSPSPSSSPSSVPSPSPTKLPTTSIPSSSPSDLPSPSPSQLPSAIPSPSPSPMPSAVPSPAPSKLPTTSLPSLSPSLMPSPSPTNIPTTSKPSQSPSVVPSPSPSRLPSVLPTPSPTQSPVLPTVRPTIRPTSYPTTWCPCITVTSQDDAAQVSGFVGTYEASGHVVNMHYHWSSHHGSEIYWGEKGVHASGDHWILRDSSNNIVTYEIGEKWTNTPPLTESSWGLYTLTLTCGTCDPTPLPTQNPTDHPTTPKPSPSPSLMPSPSPSSMPSNLPTPTPTKLPTTRRPSSAPSTMPSPSPTKLPTTSRPSLSPSALPSPSPSSIPSTMPTPSPSGFPTTSRPSISPSQMPSPSPTALPTTRTPSQSPSSMPSPSPSSMPSTLPTPKPTHMPTTSDPSLSPSLMPTPSPTKLPTTAIPSSSPSQMPSPSPSSEPSTVPSPAPSKLPTTLDPTPMSSQPTTIPSPSPSTSPTTEMPSASPSSMPSPSPSQMPSNLPTPSPTKLPTTSDPSQSPSTMPSPSPSPKPSALPTPAPTNLPTTTTPSSTPSAMPSPSPTKLPTTSNPSQSPSLMPSPSPSQNPSSVPTPSPTQFPTTLLPSLSPSLLPSPSPSRMPSTIPTAAPTMVPVTPVPSQGPSMMPSPSPTSLPTTNEPSQSPSQMPSPSPSPMPSTSPTAAPTKLPTTSVPSSSPSLMPSPNPTRMPTTSLPTGSPSSMPSPSPSPMPSTSPTPSPSASPSVPPTRSPTEYELLYCQCLQLNSTTASGFSDVYMETGLMKNNHWLWMDKDADRIYWGDAEVIGNSWIIEGDNDAIAVYPDYSHEWSVTPPLGEAEVWRVYYPWRLSYENTLISIVCVECPETSAPSRVPTTSPSLQPTPSPSAQPSVIPTSSPSKVPTTSDPSASPSLMPTPSPTGAPVVPTANPTLSPSQAPTTLFPSTLPSFMPTPSPSALPTTTIPSPSPTNIPSPVPSSMPSTVPSPTPTQLPTVSSPTNSPSLMPSPGPTKLPTTKMPSSSPSLLPSPSPSQMPSTLPTSSPSKLPTTNEPSSSPSLMPSHVPSSIPSTLPSPSPTNSPVTRDPTPLTPPPTLMPSPSPSAQPSSMPSPSPTDFPTTFCNCITANVTSVSELSGTYIASGLVINQHYHWETFDGKEIYWADGIDSWVMESEEGIVAVYEYNPYWTNTPPLEQASWEILGSDRVFIKTDWIDLNCNTCAPTPSPTTHPTKYPTTSEPSLSPSALPSPSPSLMPSVLPSPTPTMLPTTLSPSASPSSMPSPSPTLMPVVPSIIPSQSPSQSPTTPSPSPSPSAMPSPRPTLLPTTAIPSYSPSLKPSPSPSPQPSILPTPSPSALPTTERPSLKPTSMPSPSPTQLPTTALPSSKPSLMPSPSPSPMPSSLPSPRPTKLPTTPVPTQSPSLMPSPLPSDMPSTSPSPSPTQLPTTSLPSSNPSMMPSPSPSQMPSALPSPSPTRSPTTTDAPTRLPSSSPTPLPSLQPTWSPTYSIICITVNSTLAILEGTYVRLPYMVANRPIWVSNDVEIYFSEDNVFKHMWVFHDATTDTYVALVVNSPYKGDEYPPLGTTSNWQVFSGDGIAPSDNFYDVTINPENTCKPTQVPTAGPTRMPTHAPTLEYLCIIITWDLNNASYADVPRDVYGSYYHNDISHPTNNDFNKFPLYPSEYNGKPVFTKRENGNSISWFMDSGVGAYDGTWVIDSEDDDVHLVSTIPNINLKLPQFYDSTIEGSAERAYGWDLYSENNHIVRLPFSVEMSREFETCQQFDTDVPTERPSLFPTSPPSPGPSSVPTPSPSPRPSVSPTPAPSPLPSTMPSPSPTLRPTSQEPTMIPTLKPTHYPTLDYDCLNITALDGNSNYNGVYTKMTETRNERALFSDGNTGYELYYVPGAVMIDHAWVIEGSANDRMAVVDIDHGTWSNYGQNDQVPPYGTHMWKDFTSPLTPSLYDEIILRLDPLESCVPTKGPTESPSDQPTISTPSPTTPSPTLMPTSSPSTPPTIIPTSTPTPNPTQVCRVLVVLTPGEVGGTSLFEGNYIIQSVFKNGKFQWYNSNNGYTLFFVLDDWLPSYWVFQGEPGMDELAVFDEGTDGSPNTIEEVSDGEEWTLYYHGHNLQKRQDPVVVYIYCVDTAPPTTLPTPGPSDPPSLPPSPLPTPMPSLLPSPAPSSTPSVNPTPSPSSTPSVLPSPSPTQSPTLPTSNPTSPPSDSPTRYPTHSCPCIIVHSNETGFEGMYQLQDLPFSDHPRWVNFDNLAEIYWANQAVYDEYWIIVSSEKYALSEDTKGQWKNSPPIGESEWEIFTIDFLYASEENILTLDCTTCAPTPSPTAIPTTLSTPTPTTPSPTTVPTLSPSLMPSTLPSPSPSKLPTTLDPTPLSAEPTTLPSPSPSVSPTSTVPTSAPSQMPSPSPSTMPSNLPTPSPSNAPIVPTLMPSPSPTSLPTTSSPSLSPSLLPSPSPSSSPSTVPTPSPTKLPTTPIPSSSPSLLPSPSPSNAPSQIPTPSPSLSPSLSPTTSPTSDPTLPCRCLIVEDPDNELTDYVGTYSYQLNNSPNTDKRMWERQGYNTEELIYFSQFGTMAARWVIKGSTYGEWAETSADPSDANPPSSAIWMINDSGGNFYKSLTVSCTQCEETPPPTPDPTEMPTPNPTSLSPTLAPTPSPSGCIVLNVTDLSNGIYTGYFEMDVLQYNDRPMWTDKRTGETIQWADSAMFVNEVEVEDIWMLGFKSEEGEQDPHFLVRTEEYSGQYPPINVVSSWKEYRFNEFSNQTSDVAIECENTEMPTISPTPFPTYKLCLELYVETCCDPVYTLLDGIYKSETHRGGKNMWSNSENGFDIYYSTDDGGNLWSIRSEVDASYWVSSLEDNGPYPAWDTIWDLHYEYSNDLGVSIKINCSESFSPSTSPTLIPSPVPTFENETLHPSNMPTRQPTSPPSASPTDAPSEPCPALDIHDYDGKYSGIYSRLSDPKNGQAQWINYHTGTDVYWIDRGIWANNWVIRAVDGAYAMVYDNSGSIHPPLNDSWASLGGDLLHGDKYQILSITCIDQPASPSPTNFPTESPTCEGNAIHIEDPCSDDTTNGAYSGYYNFNGIHDDKRIFVRVDGEFEVLYNSNNLYADNWMIRSHDSETCNEFLLVDGYGSRDEIPPVDAIWKAYDCACNDVKRKYECNFRVTCVETMAPIPTGSPTSAPTSSPSDTDAPTPAPSENPSKTPSDQPTHAPSNGPSKQPTEAPSSAPPTQSPVPYECVDVDLQPCYNSTSRDVSFYERSNNQHQVNSNYYETKLYTEQKGYTFTAEKDMIMYEAGMAFINLASYQSVTVRVFHAETILFESDYSITGKGETHTVGTPRGDYYTFKNMNVQLQEGQEYTIVFVIHCPATKYSRAVYPLCAPHYELFAIDDFGTGVNNVYAYGEDYILPIESDFYAPFIRICYGD